MRQLPKTAFSDSDGQMSRKYVTLFMKLGKDLPIDPRDDCNKTKFRASER
jgi:hypothetical protein